MYDEANLNHKFVSSADVNGTAVYGSDNSKIGHIDHLVIDKNSGKVAYAVMGFGGFLGMGENFHAIPWGSLRYDANLEGYATAITQTQLEGAPARTDDWYGDRAWEQRTYDYYGAPYYWM